MSRPVIISTGGGATPPVLNQLIKDFDLVLDHAPLAKAWRDSGRPVTAIGDYYTQEVQEVALKNMAHLTARLVNGLPTIAHRAAEHYGLERPALLNGGMDDWLSGFALHHIQETTRLTAALTKLASGGTPLAGVLVHEDLTPRCRALVLWAQARDIPTFHLPHQPCHLLPGVPDIHREVRADYLLALGPRVRDFYGLPVESVRLTGGPQWDELYAPLWSRAEARRALGMAEDETVWVYGTTWAQTTSLRSGFDDEIQAGVTAVINAAKLAGVMLVIKLHPGEPPGVENNYVALMQAAGAKGRVTREHLILTLRAADCLVTQGPSNLCLNAAILGTPSAYIQTAGFDYATDLPFRGAAENAGDLARTAQASRGDPAWDNFCAEYNTAHPTGDAAERTAQAIREIVSKRDGLTLDEKSVTAAREYSQAIQEIISERV